MTSILAGWTSSARPQRKGRGGLPSLCRQECCVLHPLGCGAGIGVVPPPPLPQEGIVPHVGIVIILHRCLGSAACGRADHGWFDDGYVFGTETHTSRAVCPLYS